MSENCVKIRESITLTSPITLLFSFLILLTTEVNDVNNEFVYSEIYSFGRSICVTETPDEIYDMINNPRY